jgi:opacity protein-like surface antigen
VRWAAPLFALVVFPCAAQDQHDWELGAGGGYGFYHAASVIAPAGTVTAGIRNRFAITAWLTEHAFDYISGELRYTYQDGDPFLEAGRRQTNLQGQSHAIHYDVLVHTRPQDPHRIRPYFAAGLGLKRYRVSGPPNPDQPFTSIAQLNATSENKFLLTLGGGVSATYGSHLRVRADFRDYITTFPKKIITPVPLATARGLFNQFTPMVGVAYVF